VPRRQGQQQGITPGLPTIMVDPAAMAVDGGNANGEVHGAHAFAGARSAVDRFKDPEMLPQL